VLDTRLELVAGWIWLLRELPQQFVRRVVVYAQPSLECDRLGELPPAEKPREMMSSYASWICERSDSSPARSSFSAARWRFAEAILLVAAWMYSSAIEFRSRARGQENRSRVGRCLGKAKFPVGVFDCEPPRLLIDRNVVDVV
jgi:hypothetical protein